MEWTTRWKLRIMIEVGSWKRIPIFVVGNLLRFLLPRQGFQYGFGLKLERKRSAERRTATCVMMVLIPRDDKEIIVMVDNSTYLRVSGRSCSFKSKVWRINLKGSFKCMRLVFIYICFKNQ